MSDNILERDQHQALEMAWHGKTKVVPSIDRANIWLGEWDVQPVRLTAEEYLLNGVKVTVPEEETIFRFFATDDGLPIGESFNPTTYTPIYNQDVLDCVFPYVSDKGHRVVSCGSVGNRSKMFLVLAIAGLNAKDIDEKRKLAPFVNLFWSHDKTLEAYMIASAIMTVCQSTMNANLALGKEAIKADDCLGGLAPGADEQRDPIGGHAARSVH